MLPLNLSGVLWLSGSTDEINSFISNAEMKHGAVKLGHSDNIRGMLVKITSWQNMEYLQPHIGTRDKKVEAAFLLLQGSIIGLLVTEEARKE